MRPIAFFLKKLFPAEVNYNIHDKEFLIIIKYTRIWESEFHNITDVFIIRSDYNNLKYFLIKRYLIKK